MLDELDRMTVKRKSVNVAKSDKFLHFFLIRFLTYLSIEILLFCYQDSWQPQHEFLAHLEGTAAKDGPCTVTMTFWNPPSL